MESNIEPHRFALSILDSKTSHPKISPASLDFYPDKKKTENRNKDSLGIEAYQTMFQHKI